MNERKKFYNLQVCRGIAAIIVLLAHANLLINKDIFSGFFIVGWSGVDFFFVLSGFIIYYINIDCIAQKNTFKEYLSKRLIRVYPIYWVYTFCAILLHVLLFRFSNIKLITWIDLNALSLYKSILLYPTHVTANEMPILPIAWTLSYEVLFYIIFGICILVGRKFSAYIILFWIIGILLKMFSIINTANNPLLETLFSDRNFEFLYGCLIAELTLLNKIINKTSQSITILSIAILFLAVSWINEAFTLNIVPKRDILTFGIPYSLIIYALISLDTFKIKTRFKSGLVYLGDASYSIYLTHFIGIVILNSFIHKFITNDYAIFLIIVTILTVLGCCCYSYIEKPILKYINKKLSNAGIKYSELKKN
ncbi:acyltransferase family protein [Chitinophaga sp. 30R24]|uniref:acyltransferase family protein n=1 Tax=Chitinophaga sp. 30R24 TaxID=3248838 RepID=UPI003B90E53E